MESLLQSIYEQLSLGIIVNDGDVIGAGSLFLIILAVVGQLVSTSKKSRPVLEKKTIEVPVEASTEKTIPTKEEAKSAIEPEPIVEPVEKPVEQTVSWADRLKSGLSRSRSEVWGKLGNLFTGKALTDDQLEEVEELLYSADIGPTTAAELIEALELKAKEDNFGAEELKSFLKEFLKEKMAPIQEKCSEDLFKFHGETGKETKVIMVVGVNGAGKTTTIGKLATKLTGQGAKVVVGACDTFRAAAVDQLQVWCDRSGATMIRAKEGANPTGVGYDALETAMNEKADYCILDTAGRLHTKGNLMDELKRSKDVLKKLDETAPHHTLLVIDAITGQNAIRQAEEFNQTLNLNGLILTKCDGSSKAGSAVSIVNSLSIPIVYIGVGEGVEDLNKFSLDEYLDALLG